MLAALLACSCFAQQPAQKKIPTTTAKKKTEPPQTVRSFAIWLAQVSGLSATSSGLRGLTMAHNGDIWIEPVGGGARRRLTFDGGYSWPVFSSDDKNVIALRGGDLWSVPLNGAKPLRIPHTPAGTESLVGTGPEGIVLMTSGNIGTFQSETGEFNLFQGTPLDGYAISHMSEPIRSYNGGRLVVSEVKATIQIENDGQHREIAPDNASLWQPSVSHDLRRLAYARSED